MYRTSAALNPRSTAKQLLTERFRYPEGIVDFVVNGVKRQISPELIGFHRREQMQRLRHGFWKMQS